MKPARVVPLGQTIAGKQKLWLCGSGSCSGRASEIAFTLKHSADLSYPGS